MTLRVPAFVMVAVVALLCGVPTTVTGCGREPGPPSNSTANTASSADAAAAQAVKEMSDYTAALQDWFDGYLDLAEHEGASALEFADPVRPTDSEVDRATEFIERMRVLLADLKQIHPPAEVAQAHSQLRSALSGELTAMERYISALNWDSLRDVELAYRQAQESYVLMQRAINALQPYVNLSVIIQN